MFFQIEKREGQAVKLIYLSESVHYSGDIHLSEHRGRDVGQFLLGRFNLAMRKARLTATRVEMLAVKGGEQPGLGFLGIAQLMPLRGPQVKRFLRQVASVARLFRQAERKGIQDLGKIV